MNVVIDSESVIVDPSWAKMLPKLSSGIKIHHKFKACKELLRNPVPSKFTRLCDVALLDVFGLHPVNFNIYFDIKIVFIDGSIYTPKIVMEGPNIVLLTSDIVLGEYSLCYDFTAREITVVNGNIVVRPIYITDEQQNILANLEFLSFNYGIFKIFTRHFLTPTQETIISWSDNELIRYKVLLKKLINAERDH